MNQEDIIRMGHAAGLCDADGEDDDSVNIFLHLERFAKLVAEAEREACADIENKLHLITGGAHRTYSSRELFDHMNQGIKDYAAAIRARGKE